MRFFVVNHVLDDGRMIFLGALNGRLAENCSYLSSPEENFDDGTHSTTCGCMGGGSHQLVQHQCAADSSFHSPWKS